MDIKSFILGKKAGGGSSGGSGGNSGGEQVERGEMEIMDDWATIKAHSDNGTAESVYKLGDYKYVNWKYPYSPYTEMKFKFVIVGFNCTPDENGVKKGITFMHAGSRPSYQESSMVEFPTYFNSNLPEELDGFVGLSSITEVKNTANAGETPVFEFSNNIVNFFYPDATNLQEDFISTYGEEYKMYSSSTLAGTSPFNYTDDECFPLFVGKTYAEILCRLGGAVDAMITTRNLHAVRYGTKVNSTTYYATLSISGMQFGPTSFLLNDYYTNGSIGTVCFRI